MKERFSCDAVVVGAGAVGLAIARALAQDGRETIILEKNAHFGMETSSRNSEVIHAGLYYPKDSLKARLCVTGKRKLYAFCENHGVGAHRLGKLVVATRPDQGAQIETLLTAAHDNGVNDLVRLSKAEIAAREPDLRATEALFSPSTGIIDSHRYMLALLGDCERAGAHLARNTSVMAIAHKGGNYHLSVRSDGETMQLSCRVLVNSAGLWAQHVANMVEGLDATFIPPLFLAKGSYVTLGRKSPFRHLIYPLPEPGGLGVHLTLDMGGAARFGPNVEWLTTNDPAMIDYAVAPNVSDLFAPRIATWWPAITKSMLVPGYAGVRPKITGPGQPNGDFRIDGPAIHGMEGLVNLFGIESPGLTASLAIAEHVRELLNG